VQLGQPPAAFWASTPRRVDAFFAAKAHVEQRIDQRYGVVAAVIANAHRGRQARALEPADFFSSLRRSTRVTGVDAMRTAALAWAKAMQKRGV
jgi:hypothetical protein